jgi:hypothetical protein
MPHAPEEVEIMATSCPAPEAAPRPRLRRGVDDPAHVRRLMGCVGRVVRRCYDRARSAVFDADGDCMRF